MAESRLYFEDIGVNPIYGFHMLRIERINRIKRQMAYNAKNRRKNCLKKYGLTEADYDRMLAEQGGGCAICGRSYPDKPLVVDHNHRTGKVRQLLCYRCNNLVGMFETSEELLGKVAAYCAKHTITEVN